MVAIDRRPTLRSPARGWRQRSTGRRRLPDELPAHPTYLAISGGHPCLFGADALVPGEPAILAEGEFDAMLVWQEAGDLVGGATLGSCNRGVSSKALRYLLGCPRLLVAYDVDAEGDKGAERLRQLSPRMHRIRPSVGKDVTAFWQASGWVRDWIRFELARLRGG
jgi:hypothetical protein